MANSKFPLPTLSTPWTVWQKRRCGQHLWNVQAWVNAANTGLGDPRLPSCNDQRHATIPLYEQLSQQSQRIIATQRQQRSGRWNVESNLQTMGTMRANSEARNQTSDSWRLRHTQRSGTAYGHGDLAANKQATLIAAAGSAGRYQISQAAVLQQMVSQKQQQDALKAAFEDAPASTTVPVFRRPLTRVWVRR